MRNDLPRLGGGVDASRVPQLNPNVAPPAEPAASEPGPLLTARDAAKLLACSTRTVERLSAPKGTIPVVRIGKRGVRYTRAALHQWIRSQEIASLGQPIPSPRGDRTEPTA